MIAAPDGYGTSALYPRLPRGRHKLSPQDVERNQRHRLVVALAELAHEEGLAYVTTTRLVTRARVSRKTFYDCFANRDECIDYAAEVAAAYLFEPIREIEPGRSADERIAAGVDALLEAVAAEPNLAELALIHAPALGGRRGRRFQDDALAAIARLIEGAVPGDGSTERGLETIASAIVGVIACQVRRGEAGRAGDLADEVVRLARLPAVGVERLPETQP